MDTSFLNESSLILPFFLSFLSFFLSFFLSSFFLFLSFFLLKLISYFWTVVFILSHLYTLFIDWLILRSRRLADGPLRSLSCLHTLPHLHHKADGGSEIRTWRVISDPSICAAALLSVVSLRAGNTDLRPQPGDNLTLSRQRMAT